MPRLTSRIVGSMLLGIVLFLTLPLALPTLFARMDAGLPPCHQDDSLPPSTPQPQSHDCCLTGHNQPLPKSETAFFCHVTMCSVAVISLALPSIFWKDQPVPELIDAGPPSSVSPLRI